MTREKAIKELKEMIKYEWSTYQTDTARTYVAALEMAIKALEQEHVYYLPCIDCNKKMDEIRNAYDNMITKALEQEPRKGHWILTDVEGDRIWHCNCSECGKDPQDYIGGSENWWLIKSKLPKFCPNCGADMREVKE